MKKRYAIAMGIACASGLLMAGPTMAALTTSTPDFDNATMKNAGPRTGTSGKTFYNVEGDNNGTANASYGIADFHGSAFNQTAVSTVTWLTVSLTESNAAFSTPGSLEVFLASDPSANDQPVTFTAPIYTLGQTPEGIDSTTAFGTLYDLGSIAFNTTGNVNNGTVDSLTLNALTPAESAVIASALNGSTTLRLVMTPNTGSTSATFAGVGNSTFAAPTLSLTTDGTAVPEPASVGLLALGGMSLLARRHRK